MEAFLCIQQEQAGRTFNYKAGQVSILLMIYSKCKA